MEITHETLFTLMDENEFLRNDNIGLLQLVQRIEAIGIGKDIIIGVDKNILYIVSWSDDFFDISSVSRRPEK